MEHEVSSLFEFLKKSPTAFHAVDALCGMLEADGFQALAECDRWRLERGKKYFVTRNRSSLIAFTIPREESRSFRIIASHSDSPTFRIKENAELEVRGKYVQLDVERYGGMIFSSWFDRPLSVAGRVLVRTEEGISTRLVNIDRDLVMIPNVAIHMNREVNNGYKYNAQVDLMPLFGDASAKGSFRRLIAEACGVQEADVLGSDLYLYNRMGGTVWGANEEFMSAGRLDDLECAYSSVRALTGAMSDAAHVNVCCVFDNEEIGSETKQGAASVFLPETLAAFSEALGLSAADHRALLADSMMLSCDNGHARHPNHPELADTNEAPVLNGGVVVKHSPRYATDGVSAAVFTELCRRAEVPVQYYANRPDQMGGATLGNIADTKLPIPTVDIGMAQLAMHSCFETMGSRDVEAFVRAVRACYESSLRFTPEGVALR